MDDMNGQHTRNQLQGCPNLLLEIQEQIMDKGAWINPETNSVWICSKATLAMDLAIAENVNKDNLTNEQIVPPKYHEFLDIFNEKQASQFPDK